MSGISPQSPPRLKALPQAEDSRWMRALSRVRAPRRCCRPRRPACLQRRNPRASSRARLRAARRAARRR
jgi:hypothetical protein